MVAGLELLAKHAMLFRDWYVDRCDEILNILLKGTAHPNGDVSDRSGAALEAFLSQVCSRMILRSGNMMSSRF